MITKNGQVQQLKLIAGAANRFADIFVFGISGITLPTTATALDFAFASSEITGSYVDMGLNQVVFYGTIPGEIAGNIREVGLVSQSDEFVKTGLPNAIVYGFDANEAWFSDATFAIGNNSSIGTGNYAFANTVSNNYIAKIVNGINVSRYDTIKTRITADGVSTVRLILKNDTSNYAWKDINLTQGDNMVSTQLSTYTTVGAFNPVNVSEIRFEIRTAAATNTIEFDAITFSSALNGGLVARTVLSSVVYKRPGAGMEIEVGVGI